MRRWRALGWTAVVALAWRCSPSVPAFDALPPSTPEAGAASSSGIVTFAVDSVLLGEARDAGPSDINSWKTLGYDLDGKITTRDSTDVCQLATGAPRGNQNDGLGGRDNGFALNVVPMIESFVSGIQFQFCGGIFGPCPDAGPAGPPLSTRETSAIRRGLFTLQIAIIGLTGDPDQSATGLHAEIFDSDAFDAPDGGLPTFDSNTDWPVLPESLANGTDIPGGALAQFSSAYVTHGTFVAGTNEHITLPLHANIDGFVFTLPIHEAIITFDHSAPDDAANGVVAGVVDPTELGAIFARLSVNFCGSAFNLIARQLREAADILSDRSNHAGTPCTAISFGMGFHARRIANPTKVAAPLDYPDPCDAGTDAGTD